MRNTLTSLTVLLLGCVLAAQAQTPAFTSAGVLNAASLAAGTIAPGMVAAIKGSNLGSANFFSCAGTLPLPVTCDGVQVLVNGLAAPMVYESAGELSFQVPFTVSGSATIQVTSSASGAKLSSAIVTVPVAATVPGLYSADGTGSGTGYYYDVSQSSLGTEFSKPVQAGDTVVMYGTGFGATSPVVAAGIRGPDPVAACAPVTVTVGTVSATVQVAGLEPNDSPAQGTPGSDEVEFTVPSGLAAGTYPVVVTVGGVNSQPALILVVAAPPLEITSLSPASPAVGTNQVVTVHGSGFLSGLTVSLYVTGSDIPTTISGSQIQSVTTGSFQMTVTFAAAGNYNITVTNPGGIESRAFSFTVVPAGPSTVTITNVVSGATYGLKGDGSGTIIPGFSGQVIPTIQAGSWVIVTGQGLAPDTRIWQTSDFVGLGTGLPLSLDGVSVTIDGKSAAVYYISSTQLNVQAPTDSAVGTVSVVVKNAAGTATGTGTMQAYAPGFFPLQQAGGVSPTATIYAAAINNSDGTLAVPANYYGAGVASRAAKPGEYVQIYGTGFGPTNPAAPAGQIVSGQPSLANPQLQIRIGGVVATVYQGTGYLVAPGEYQFNVLIPALPDGDQPIVATIGGVSSPSGISIPIKN